MGLQVEVVLVHSGGSAVDDSTRFGVAVMRSVCWVHGEESRMVALAADDDGQLWPVGVTGGIETFESFADLWHLLADHDGKLALCA